MAIDPRRRFPFGQMAPMLYGAGTLNNAAPSFQGPAYYNQMFNRPLQDWSQFMPTNSPLAGGGGALYQTPWGYGTGGGSGWGGFYGGMPGGGLMGGGMMGGYPGWGGGYPGYTQPGFGGYRPPQFGGGTTPGFIPRPSPVFVDPSYPPPTTTGRHHPEMYDADGNYVGAEGKDTGPGVPWQNTFLAPLGNRLGWNPVYEGWQSPLLDEEGNVAINPDTGQPFRQTTAPGYDYTMDESAGTQPTVGGRVFNQDDPMAYAPPSANAVTGLLGDYGTMATEEFDSPTAGTNFMGPLADPSYGDVTSQVDTFRDVPMSQPGTDFFGGDVTAPATPAPVVQQVQHPDFPATAPVDNFSAMKQAQMKASTANAAAAAQAAQAAEAFRQSQAAEAFRRDEARLANLRGRDEFDAREMAELEARVGAYRGDPVGRAIAIQERDERGRDDTSGERSAGMGGGRGGFAGPDRDF